MTMARRGYVFLVVLLVLVIGLIMVFAGVERAGAQAAIAQERVRDYQRHHEMLGVRDILSEWLGRPGKRDALIEAARKGTVFYDADLPGGLIVTVRAEDAQGAVPLPNAGIGDPQALFALNDLIARLPPDRPDLVRSGGPSQISLAGAPEEVLRALAQGDQELLDILRAMQAEPLMDAARFMTSLSTVGMSERSTELSRVLTFTPSYFRLRARVDDGKEVRRYSMLVDVSPNPQANSLVMFRSLRFEPGRGDPPEDIKADSGAGATRGR